MCVWGSVQQCEDGDLLEELGAAIPDLAAAAFPTTGTVQLRCSEYKHLGSRQIFLQNQS